MTPTQEQRLRELARRVKAEGQPDLESLDFALQAGKTRYSRNHGEPEPTPSFPVEVVFTMEQWYAVLKALGRAKGALGEMK